MVTRTRHDVLWDLRLWGVKLQRVGNKLSLRETEAFHRVQMEAKDMKITDAEIDKTIKEGRTPQPRYGGTFQ